MSDKISTSMIASEALGQSEAFLDFQERLSRVAPIHRPVLILGERGTGKELAATRLHFLSRRWQGPFITLNCSSLSPSLVEAELFGHEKGAFTGAHRRRSGRFEAADKGTLFLDEIATIPMEAQEKILRVVEYGVFEPVGSSSSIEVDVRIISATNADLEQMARGGKFMFDLLDRLSFEVLFLPPLRKRQEDIMLLGNHFARRMAVELGREEIPVFTAASEKALCAHPWRGNVRELKNVVERAVYRADSHEIDTIVFNPFVSPYHDQGNLLNRDGDHGMDPFKHEIENGDRDCGGVDLHGSDALSEHRKQWKRDGGGSKDDGDPMDGSGFESLFKSFDGMPLKQALKSLERTMLKRALEASKYNQKKAALHLGLTYDQLRGMMRKYKGEGF